jgi:hypothetical protein
LSPFVRFRAPLTSTAMMSNYERKDVSNILKISGRA